MGREPREPGEVRPALSSRCPGDGLWVFSIILGSRLCPDLLSMHWQALQASVGATRLPEEAQTLPGLHSKYCHTAPKARNPQSACFLPGSLTRSLSLFFNKWIFSFFLNIYLFLTLLGLCCCSGFL